MAHIVNIPIEFRFLKTPASWEIRTLKGKPHHSEQRFAFPKVLGDPFEMKLSELDGWACRDKFFQVKEGDDRKLLKFLTMVGVFSNLELSGHWSDEVTQHSREGHPAPIDLRGLWRFREGLRACSEGREEL